MEPQSPCCRAGIVLAAADGPLERADRGVDRHLPEHLVAVIHHTPSDRFGARPRASRPLPGSVADAAGRPGESDQRTRRSRSQGGYDRRGTEPDRRSGAPAPAETTSPTDQRPSAAQRRQPVPRRASRPRKGAVSGRTWDGCWTSLKGRAPSSNRGPLRPQSGLQHPGAHLATAPTLRPAAQNPRLRTLAHSNHFESAGRAGGGRPDGKPLPDPDLHPLSDRATL
jgi:hypothetical protein